MALLNTTTPYLANIESVLVPSFENIEKQVAKCHNLMGKKREYILQFLKSQNITDATMIDMAIKRKYWVQVCNSELLSEEQKRSYKNSLEEVQYYNAPEIYDSIKEDVKGLLVTKSSDERKIIGFMMDNNITSPSQIDYAYRCMYVEYIKLAISESKIREHVKIFDKLKLLDIKRMADRNPFVANKFDYSEEVVFLLYHPDYSVASEYYYARDKSEFVFDFSLNAPAVMKRQIFDMLKYVLSLAHNRKNRREMFLVPLKKLYLYCVENEIEDITQMDDADIMGFRMSLRGKVGTKENTYMLIIYEIQKFLFLESLETNWVANTWHLERFEFPDARMNPSRPIMTLEFGAIINKADRDLVKEYIKYLIAITDLAISNIRNYLYNLIEFANYCNKIGCTLTDVELSHFKKYIKSEEKKDYSEGLFNRKLNAIDSFFNYMLVNNVIDKITFNVALYKKAVVIVHNDRTVKEEIIAKILSILREIPLIYRLMFLNIWAIGLRINEVCTIKSDAYSFDGETAWIEVQLFKTKDFKKVPIPTNLYHVMMRYIAENGIKPGQYVFQNKRGGAYDAGTYSKYMKRFLSENGIDPKYYNFRVHDFRHTIATGLFNSSVKLGVIRDYLGHKSDEMTKQYIDYTGNIIEKKSKDYFSKAENQLYVGDKK